MTNYSTMETTSLLGAITSELFNYCELSSQSELTLQKAVARGNMAAATPFSSMDESFWKQQKYSSYKPTGTHGSRNAE